MSILHCPSRSRDASMPFGLPFNAFTQLARLHGCSARRQPTFRPSTAPRTCHVPRPGAVHGDQCACTVVWAVRVQRDRDWALRCGTIIIIIASFVITPLHLTVACQASSQPGLGSTPQTLNASGSLSVRKCMHFLRHASHCIHTASTPNASITLSFLRYSTECLYDWTFVYDGNSSQHSPVLAAYAGGTAVEPVTATSGQVRAQYCHP